MNNTTNTMTKQNYLLIQMDRYEVGSSQVNIVTDDFLDAWLEFNGNTFPITEAPVAILDHDVTGWDSEEVTFLWIPTNKEVTEDDQEFMNDFLKDVKEHQEN